MEAPSYTHTHSLVCKLYYQFILVQGLLMGLACALLYHPTITVTTQYFTTRKAFSVGIIMSGSGIGTAFPHPKHSSSNPFFHRRNPMALSALNAL